MGMKRPQPHYESMRKLRQFTDIIEFNGNHANSDENIRGGRKYIKSGSLQETSMYQVN